jgi:hypothetical protein
MTPPFARPGQMGLSCGKCGDAMLVTSHDGRLKPEIWFCQRCEQAWSVPMVPVMSARVQR